MINHRHIATALGAALALCAVSCSPTDTDGAGETEVPGIDLDLPTDIANSVEESTLELELRETPLGWTATLTNHGNSRILVVAPGDGSSYGWRTPRLDWLIETPDGVEFTQQARGRCGMMNPLQPEELLIINPGASTSFDTFIYPPWVDLEQYQVSVRYTNDPAIAWKGGELGPHDTGALEALERSTVCNVASNRVLVDRR